MIVYGSKGREDEIEDLLIKSFHDRTPRQIKAWMEYQYDPQLMFLFESEGKITACLQMERRILQVKDAHLETCLLTLGCTHPDFRGRKQFKALLEAALSVSSANVLCDLATSRQPKLFEKRSFLTIGRTVEFWPERNFKNVLPAVPASKQDDLYDVYCQFLNNFAVHFVPDKETFDKQIQYAKASGKKIYTAMEKRKPSGFALVQEFSDHVRLESVVYLSSKALESLMARAAMHHKPVCVMTGPDERLERLFQPVHQRPRDWIMARLTNPRLAGKVFGADVHTAEDLMVWGQGPMWLAF